MEKANLDAIEVRELKNKIDEVKAKKYGKYDNNWAKKSFYNDRQR